MQTEKSNVVREANTRGIDEVGNPSTAHILISIAVFSSHCLEVSATLKMVTEASLFDFHTDVHKLTT